MEIMSKVICPYCESWLDIERMLTLEKLKEMQFYLTCPECNKTFSTFAKTEIKVNVSRIEDRIQGEKEVFYFGSNQRWVMKPLKMKGLIFEKKVFEN